MARHKITKSIDFCYGHRLLEYDGKCKHLHGHNGLIEVDIEADSLDDLGMVMDFTAEWCRWCLTAAQKQDGVAQGAYSSVTTLAMMLSVDTPTITLLHSIHQLNLDLPLSESTSVAELQERYSL